MIDRARLAFFATLIVLRDLQCRARQRDVSARWAVDAATERARIAQLLQTIPARQGDEVYQAACSDPRNQ